jgi:hypothetical protein
LAAATKEPCCYSLRTCMETAGLRRLPNWDQVEVSQEDFVGALLTGRDKGLFEIDDTPDEPVVKLTKLGGSLAR